MVRARSCARRWLLRATARKTRTYRGCWYWTIGRSRLRVPINAANAAILLLQAEPCREESFPSTRLPPRAASDLERSPWRGPWGHPEVTDTPETRGAPPVPAMATAQGPRRPEAEAW